MPTYEPEWFHDHVCKKIQDWHNGIGKNRLMLFMPPQHGKSQISSRHAPAWILGKNPDCKIAIAAYNGTIASGFSRDAQRIIVDPEYKQIFPNTRIPQTGQPSTDETRNNAQVEVIGHRGSITAVGVGGGLTSKTVDRMIIDDVYKDQQEAWSPIQRKNVEDWFDAVVETRLHNESKVLVVFTRWHEEDLAGYLLEHQPDLWDVIKFPAIKEENNDPNDPRAIGEALWPKKHSVEKILSIKARRPTIFDNLYQQDPKPQVGLLYGNRFKLYELNYIKEVKKGSYSIITYIDVADSGSDYLCAITAIKKGDYFYVIDVVYSNEGVEVTAPKVVQSILETDAARIFIESNAGGSIYGKNIKKDFEIQRTKQKIGKAAVFKPFHQGANKESRITSNAASVLEFIVFPADWHMKWPLFWKHITKFEKEFKKNQFDDSADTLTGLIEKGDSNYGSYAYAN